MKNKVYGGKRVRRAALHFVTGRAVQAVGRAILILAIVRLLPVHDYGAYMLIIGLAEALLMMASFGIVSVGQRFLPELVTKLQHRRLKTFVLTLLGLQMMVLSVFAVSAWLAWPHLAKLMHLSAAQVQSTYLAPLLFLLIPCFRFLSELQEALLEQGRAQIARALMPLGRVAGLGLLVAIGIQPDLEILLIVDVITTVVCIVLAAGNVFSSLAELGTGTDDNIDVSEMRRFAWHMAGVNFLGSLTHTGVVRLAIANALSVVETGLYAFLQSIERMVSRYLPGTLLRGIVRPVLVARAASEGGMDTVRAGASLLMKANLLVVGGGCVVTAVAGDAIVAAASGGKFPDAGPTLFTFLVVLLISAQRQVIEMVAQITGHTATLRATSLLAPVTLGFIWLFASYGLPVVILTLATGTIVSNSITASVLVRRTNAFRVDWSGVLRIIGSGLAAAVAGLFIYSTGFKWLGVCAAVVLYAVLIWIAKPFFHSEVELVQRGFGKKLSKPLRWLARG
jgi:O-antigen/teichoic acid export membrane protein